MGNAKLPPGFDAAKIQAYLAEGRRYDDDLATHREELMRDHEGEWVIAYKGEFRFGSTLEEVVQAGRAAEWPLDIVAIDHLLRERPAVLLRGQ